MSTNYDIRREMELNKNDMYVVETTVNNAKNKFADELKAINSSDIKKYISLNPKPIKYKKPLKIKIKEWFTNLQNKIVMMFT